MSAPRKPTQEYAGEIYIQGEDRSWIDYYVIIKDNDMHCYGDSSPQAELLTTIDLSDCEVFPGDASRMGREWSMEVSHRERGTYNMGCDTREEWSQLMEVLSVAAVPVYWPGGLGLDNHPVPIPFHTQVDGEGRLLDTAYIRRLTGLDEAAEHDRKALLLHKIRLAGVVFDPEAMQNPKYDEARSMKRGELIEIEHSVQAYSELWNDHRVLEEAFAMLRVNLMRSLPARPDDGLEPDEDDEPFMDPGWPHLNVVYMILLQLMSSDAVEYGLKKRLMDGSFVRQLMLLFDSEDARERDSLKTVVHRVYSKLTQRRALIRRAICNSFFEFVCETGRHNGIAEMLEILASIINGFATPIKEEHKSMLHRALLPLHKPSLVSMYHPQLSYCMAIYASKDHTITRTVIRGLLRFWPFGNSSKQVMFLNELEDIFEFVQEDDMEDLQSVLSLRLAKIISGLHFQVAERALGLWSSSRFSALAVDDAKLRGPFLRTLYPALRASADAHWHPSVQAVAASVLEQYQRVDPTLCAELDSAYDAGETTLPPSVASGFGDQPSEGPPENSVIAKERAAFYARDPVSPPQIDASDPWA